MSPCGDKELGAVWLRAVFTSDNDKTPIDEDDEAVEWLKMKHVNGAYIKCSADLGRIRKTLCRVLTERIIFTSEWRAAAVDTVCTFTGSSLIQMQPNFRGFIPRHRVPYQTNGPECALLWKTKWLDGATVITPRGYQTTNNKDICCKQNIANCTQK